MPGLAMSKSALVVDMQHGCIRVHTQTHTFFSLYSLLPTENNMSFSVSVEGFLSTKPFHVWMRLSDD